MASQENRFFDILTRKHDKHTHYEHDFLSMLHYLLSKM